MRAAQDRRNWCQKARVYELAKELGVDSKTVLNKLEAMGEFVKSASSTVEPAVARSSECFRFQRAGQRIQSKKPAVPRAGCSGSFTYSCTSCHSGCSRGIHGKAFAPKPARPAASKSESPNPGQRMPRPGDSRQHGDQCQRQRSASAGRTPSAASRLRFRDLATAQQ